MAKKREPLFEFECEQCGDKPKGDKQGNWQVASATCKECGGRVTIKLKHTPRGASNL